MISCLFCGTTLGIYVDGETPHPEAHACDHAAEVDRHEINDILDELRATRNPDRE